MPQSTFFQDEAKRRRSTFFQDAAQARRGASQSDGEGPRGPEPKSPRASTGGAVPASPGPLEGVVGPSVQTPSDLEYPEAVTASEAAARIGAFGQQATRSVIQGVAEIPASAVESIAILSKAVNDNFVRLPGDPEGGSELSDYATAQWAEGIRDLADWLAPEGVEELEDDFIATTLPHMLGEVAGFATGAGAASKLAKLPAWISTASLGGSVNGVAGYYDALANGADEETALASFLANGASGAVTETLPIARLLGPQQGRLLVNATVQALEEGSTEALQGVVGNLAAQGLYDEDREVLEGVLESGAAGGGVGLAFGLLFGARRRGPRPKPGDPEFTGEASELPSIRETSGSKDYDDDGYSYMEIEDETLSQAADRAFLDYFSRPKNVQKQAVERGAYMDEGSDFVQKQRLAQSKAAHAQEKWTEEHYRPMAAVIGKEGVGLEAAEEYLIAVHSLESNPVVRERSGEDAAVVMEDSEAEFVVDKYESGERGEDFKALKEMVAKRNTDALRVMEESDLITPEVRDQLQDQWTYYVPFRTATKPGSFRGGRSLSVKGKEFKTREGRTSRPDSPLAFLLEQDYQMLARAEKNKVGQALLRFVQDNPSEGWAWRQTEKDAATGAEAEAVAEVEVEAEEAVMPPALKEGEVGVKVGGKQYVIEFADPLMARAFNGIGRPQMGPVMRKLGSVARAYAMMQTALDPTFVLKNISRDLQTAGINMSGERGFRASMGMLKDSAFAWNALRGRGGEFWSQRAAEYKADGGEVAWTEQAGFEAQLKKLDGLIQEEAPSSGRDHTLNALRYLRDMALDRAHAAENAVRLAAYSKARDMGMSRDASAVLAKDLTVDFERRGEYGAHLNTMYLFYNAGAQGTARMFRALNKPKVQAAVGALMASAATQELINQVLMGEDYEDIPEWVKNSRWILPLPEDFELDDLPGLSSIAQTGDSGRLYLSFPLPYGYNVFHAAGRNLAAVGYAGKSPTQAAAEVGASAYEAFNPIGGGSTLTELLAPTFMDPIAQVEMNKSFTGKRIHPGPKPYTSDEDQPSAHTQYFPWTEDVWVDAAEQIYNLTDVTGEGGLDFHPESLEHFFDFLKGGVGRLATRSFGAVRAATDDDAEKLELHEVPALRDFLGSTRASYDE